ncbi:hypothetical protein CKAH01_15255 [Colletotrichum kahawae]|uniref:Ankyrin repeat protein n=1 Tax=Colletotrichum kahawae TaxID=34407 RepID=A0AAD9YIW0_COLKA|nr:hypothetical protein CKAH01_15255 [Colletotrichum kahawae]
MEGVKRALINGHDINTPDWTLFEHSTEPYDDLGSSSYEEHYRTPVRSSLTSLHWACFYGNEELISFLLEKGADFQQRAELGFRCDLDSDGSREWWDSGPLGWHHSHRAMMTATKEQYIAFPPFCHLQISIGANALFFALKGSSSPVHRAKWDALTFDKRGSLVTEDESGCRLAITKRLVRAGSSLVTCEATKLHALHQAAAYRDIDVARFLMDELDVDPDVRNIYDETPLHVLARNRKHGPYKRTDEMVELLVERGADTNLKGSNGRTPGEMGLSIPAIL